MTNGVSPRAPGRRRHPSSSRAAPATYSKYGAVRCEIEHKGKVIKCASKAEAKRFGELILLDRARVIAGLEFHPRFPLFAYCEGGQGSIKPTIAHYVGDAAYRRKSNGVSDPTWIVEDIKGFSTEVFKLKAKWFRACSPHIELRILKAGKGRGG